jgi:hypothetical protein
LEQYFKSITFHRHGHHKVKHKATPYNSEFRALQLLQISQ